MEKIKLLISGQDSGGYGGSEKFLIDLSRVLKKNCDVTFTIVAKSRFEKLIKENKEDLLSIPFRMDILGGWKGLVKFFVFIFPAIFLNFQLLSKFKRQKGRIVIIPGFSDKLILTPIAKIIGLKVFWIEYAPLTVAFQKNFGIPKFFYSVVSSLIDQIIVPTHYTQKALAKLKIFIKRKIKIIPCGLEILSKEKIHQLFLKKEAIKKKLNLKTKFIVGMISRIEEGKGQDVLVKAAKIVSKKIKNLAVLIVGEGDDEKLKKLIKEFKLQKSVYLLGFRKDLYETLSIFDVFVFPTQWKMEGFGLVPLEAIMMGIPVIASNFGPVPEVLGQGALLVQPTSHAVAKGILEIINNRKLKSKLVERGKWLVEKKYNIEQIAQDYLKLLNNR